MYRLGRVIGSGKFGTVRHAVPFTNPDRVFALKSIMKERMKEDLKQLEEELEVMKTIDHPNLIKFYETYVDDKYYHFVIEFCEGGELFERIADQKCFNEKEAVSIIKQLLSAVQHLHMRGICHRDLKPENVLFEASNDNCAIKLIDFGLSKFVRTQN